MSEIKNQHGRKPADVISVTPRVWEMGGNKGASYRFDLKDADGNNTAWLVAAGQLHTVSLEDGSITESWDIQNAGDNVLRDITFMTANM